MNHPLLPDNLPHGRALVEEGLRIGDDVTVGLSLLCEEHGVRSEVEYRQKMLESGRLMTCMNIGLQTWDETARALELIHAESERRGFRIDRYQLNLDRRMGLPPELWSKVAKETGPTLETCEDWMATSRTVPIQPHLGDMMIGSPMSVDNARRALEAGVNYIGNMSQFGWKYPAWPGDDVEQVAETIKALGLMASKVDDDAMLHSYLDDGYSAQFKDYCSYVGWALLERYIINEVIGARVAIAYGGLTHDPVMKAAMILALEAIKPPGTFNPFYHGNTTAYTSDLDTNFAVLSLDVLYIMLAQLRSGSGAPSLAVPVTEALRIPSWEEIVQAHTIARRIASDAERLMEAVDWPHIEGLRDRLVQEGRRFYENVIEGLADLGIDTEDPMQLLLVLRRMGGAEIERRFGVGELPRRDTDLYQPVIPTDTFRDFMQHRERLRTTFSDNPARVDTGARLVVGSTDVHEYAMLLIIDALQALGVEPIVAGTSVDPDEFADLALEAGASAILVSTHNGMALTYAQQLRREVEARQLSIPIAMGGTLNQDTEDQSTPVDVTKELTQLGVRVCTDIADVLDLVARA